jgi:type 2A phosphatase activator TIP41
MPHLPDMVFPNNTLSLRHESGCTISFNALDALESVVNGQLPLEISCADAWKESRMDSGHMDKIKQFDWTFSSTYSGTVQGKFQVVETDQRIDLDKLRQKEQILYYQDLTLFEDELHDNGIAVSNVKIRVMPSGFFILLRYFLRVDNVLVKINDTRFYHEFETDFFLREYTSKEAKASDLNVPLAVLNEPSEVAEILPIVKSCYEKFTLPIVNKPDEPSAQENKATE